MSSVNCVSGFVRVSILEWGLRPNLPSLCIACLHKLFQFSCGTIQLTLLAGWWTSTTLSPFFLPTLFAVSGTVCDLVQTWSQCLRYLCKKVFIKLVLGTSDFLGGAVQNKMQIMGLCFDRHGGFNLR